MRKYVKTWCILIVIISFLSALSGCGKKGDPQPPREKVTQEYVSFS